jgi:heavy metal sensor kinase
MLFQRLLTSRRTLRFRMMVWNAFVVVATAVVTLVGVREGVRLAILHEMDQILTEDVNEIEYGFADARATVADLQIAAGGDTGNKTSRLLDDLERKALGHKQHGWFVQLLDPADGVLWSSQGAPAELAVPDSLGDFAPVTLGALRVVQNRQTTGKYSALVVRVGASTDLIHEDMRRIDRLVALAVGVVLIAAPLVGYWLAGRAIRPLAAMTHAAARLRPSRMDERLPQRHTGDELDQLAVTVNGLLNRIADYLAQRRDFVANAAHELRTPVAAIRSSVEVALGADRSKQEYDELLSGVIDECTSLEVLVNQLLLLAETEADRLTVHGTRVDLGDLVSRAADMFAGVAESKQVNMQVTLQPDVAVEGNPHHLRQVVNNLIDNAIKFTLGGGRVDVELSRDDNARAVLTVRDTGIGIAAEDLPHIFDRFFRGDKSHGHDIQGSGLGLSICKAVVEAHGGQVLVTSASSGTTFQVYLPLAPADAASAPEEPKLPRIARQFG